MIVLDNNYIMNLLDNVNAMLKDGKVPIIRMDDYLDNYLPYCSSQKEITYPYTINVPKPIDYMLKTGDFSPQEVITIKEPILYNGKPIWTRSSLNGVSLGFGYENSDRNKLSDISLGNVSLKSGPHFHLAGKSGGGKSVALANIVYNILFAYSPFEVNVHLVDAKISEAARYAQNLDELIPHIKTIGATEDTGYVISILDMIAERASKLNALFSKAGVNNLKAFRSKTGLTIPRDILIVDEYQFQYQKATQKEASKLTNMYDQFCTAGRSSGTHLMLCTQSFLPELKKSLFKNIELRACLTCEQATSEGVLGNKVASNCKFIGELYFNTASDQSVESTRMFKVPLQDPEVDFPIHKKFLSEAGLPYGIKPNLNFFDESTVLEPDDISELFGKYGSNRRLVLGTPAFLKNSENDVYYQNLTFDDFENILLFSPLFNDVVEFLRLMSMNFDIMDSEKNKVYYLIADKSLGRTLKANKAEQILSIKKNTDPAFVYLCGMVYRKMAMLESDEEIFSGSVYIDAEVKKFMESHYPSMLSDLNIKRASLYAKKLSSNAIYTKLYGLNKKDIPAHALMTLSDLLRYSPSFKSSKVTPSNLPVDYINLVGLDKISGVSRGSTMTFGSVFSEILMDSAEGNVCFLCYAANITGVNQYKTNFKFIFTSNAKNQETKLGIELPASVSPKLVYAVNPSTSEIFRFKRLSLEEEFKNNEDLNIEEEEEKEE